MTSKQMDLTKNFFALGPHVLAVRAEHGARRSRWIDEKFGDAAGHRRGATSGRSRPATPSARRPRCSTRTTASRRRSCRRAPTGTSPATRRRRSASSPRRKLAERDAVLRLATRSPRPATSSTSSSGYKTFGVKTFQAEDEIAAIGAAIGASYGGALGLTGIVRARASRSRPRRWASRSWSSCRSSSSTSSAPARRPGMPTKTEQARPAPGHVRPQRRLADAGRRAGHARPSASTSRSRPWRIALKYMTPVVYLSDAFLATGSEPWRIPTSPTCPTSASPNAHRAATASTRTSATRRRSPGRGPCPARPASSTASAASRRPTSPATSATTRTTTTG